MAAAWGRVAAASCALALAIAAFRTEEADRTYGTGLDLAVRPDEEPTTERPGRLDAYEAAAALDPFRGLYALRAGQMRLRRALKADRATRPAELAAARVHLADAARLRPLDPAPQGALAQ